MPMLRFLPCHFVFGVLSWWFWVYSTYNSRLRAISRSAQFYAVNLDHGEIKSSLLRSPQSFVVEVVSSFEKNRHSKEGLNPGPFNPIMPGGQKQNVTGREPYVRVKRAMAVKRAFTISEYPSLLPPSFFSSLSSPSSSIVGERIR